MQLGPLVGAVGPIGRGRARKFKQAGGWARWGDFFFFSLRQRPPGGKSGACDALAAKCTFGCP